MAALPVELRVDPRVETQGEQVILDRNVDLQVRAVLVAGRQLLSFVLARKPVRADRCLVPPEVDPAAML